MLEMDDADCWDDNTAEARQRREIARKRARDDAALAAVGTTLSGVLAAPFVVGWSLLTAAFYGGVWLLGLAAVAGVAGVVYVLVR